MKKNLLSLLFVAALSILSASAELTFVLNESFDGVTSGLPAGWTQEYVQLPVSLDADTASFSWSVESGDSLTYPSGCVSGNGRAVAKNRMNSTMEFKTRLITPVMNLSGVFQPQFGFSHAEVAYAGWSDTLRVYYRTKANGVWMQYPGAVYYRNAHWQSVELPIVNPSATYQLAFEITERMGRGVVLDDVFVRPQLTCENVQNIEATNVHAFDAFVSWDAYGYYSEFQVMLTKQPITDFSNIPDSVIVQQAMQDVYNPEYQFNNLESQTTYYVYVRSDCDENALGWTDWVEGSFRTRKVAYLPYTENFNSTIGITGNVAFGLPEGWTMGNDMELQIPFVIKTGNASDRSSYSVDSTAYLSFAGALSAANEPVPAGEYVYAASPEVFGTSLQGTEVSFWVTAFDRISCGSSQYAAELLVGVMTDPDNFSTFQALDTVKIESSYLFKRVNVSLANYTGSAKFVALVSNNSKRNAVYVDNFSIKRPSAITPSHVKVSGVSTNGLHVTLDAGDADSWNIVVSSAYDRNGRVDPSTILYQQTGLTGNSHDIVGSFGGQTVMVYAQALKGGVASAWSFPVTLRVPTAMPLLSDSVSYTNSFEPGAGEILLSLLNNELRTSSSLRGVGTVYYPLLSINQQVNTYPRYASTAPNYRGAHMQLCGNDSWFVLPEVQNNINELKMVFRHATIANSFGKIEIGVMTDPYDLSTFEHVALFTSEITDYNRCLVSFDSYTGAGKYIAFRSLDAGAGDAASINLIDEVIVSVLGNCREASNVDISAHSNSADVTWNGGGMSAWIVGIGTKRSMIDATYFDVTTPEAHFTNLESEKKYYFTIQTICGEDTLDLDDVSYNFTTPRGLPFEEHFSGSLPSGWSIATGSATSVFNGGSLTASSSWMFTNSSSYIHDPMSGYAAYVNVYGTSCYKWLISPVLNVDIEEGKPLELVFDMGMKAYSSSVSAGVDDKFMLIVSTDGGNSWHAENATVWSNDNKGDYLLNDLYWDGAQTYSVDFSPYIGKRIQFAFYVESTVSNEDNYLLIDNVVLREADPDCGGLTNLRAVATSASAASLTWQLLGNQPKPAIVQVSPNGSFTSFVYNDTVRANTLSLTGLNSSTTYYVRARQACANDADWTTVEFNTFCDAVSPAGYSEDFTSSSSTICWTSGFTAEHEAGTAPGRVSANDFGGVLEIKKGSVGETASDGAYAISPEFMVGDTIYKYQVVFSACTYSNEATNVHRIAVCVVSDPSDPGFTMEKIATINLAYAEDSLSMKTYVVSLESYETALVDEFGHYVMFLSEAGTDSTNYVYIDNVSIEPAQGCHQVLDMTADSITVSGARLRWTGNGESYEIAVSPKPVRPDTCSSFVFHQTVQGTSCHVTGLEATSKYYAYVRANCADDEHSRWSASTVFTTSFGVPFLETFDSWEANDEDSWTHYKGLFNADSVLTSNLAKGGTGLTEWNLTGDIRPTGMSGKAQRVNVYGSSCNAWLVTPAIDLSTATNAEITLTAKVAVVPYSSSTAPSSFTSNDDRFGVLISDDGGRSWKKKNATIWGSTSAYTLKYNTFGGGAAKQISIDMTQYAGKSVAVAFYGESTSSDVDMYLYVDSVQMSKFEAVCLGVRNATFALTDDHTAHAEWTIFGDPNEVELQLSSTADFSDTLALATTTALSYDFQGLEFNSTYYLRITQVGCTTHVDLNLKTPRAIPYSEPFSASSVSTEWTVMQGDVRAALNDTLPVANNSTTAWRIATNSNGLPANHLYGCMYNQTSLSKQWLVSPEIVLSAQADENVALLFDLALTAHNSAAAATATAGQEFRVLLSTDNGAHWRAANQWIFSDATGSYRTLSSLSATGERIQLDLSQYRNQRVRIALYKESTHPTNDNDLHIANLQVRVVGDPCNTPQALTAVSVGSTTASIQWQGQTDKPSVIDYALAADFSAAKSDTILSGNSHTLAGLLKGKTYFVRVYQICGANSVSDYSSTLQFTTSYSLPYVEPFATISDWSNKKVTINAGGLDAVIAGTATFSTGTGWKSSSATAILGANHIYTMNSTSAHNALISPEIDLSMASNEPLALRFNLALTKTNTGAATTPDATAMNNNQFNVLVSTDGGQTWSNQNRWIWSAATSADYKYSDIPNGNGKGYLIDFSRFAGQKIVIALVSASTKSACINVNNLSLDFLGSSCFGVNNLIVNQVDTAALLTIMPADSAHLWQYAWGKTGADLLTMPTRLTTTRTFTTPALELNSMYDVYVRSICAEGDTSSWAGPFIFATPTGLTYEADFSNTLNGWTRYTGDPAAVFAGGSLTMQTANGGWTATDAIATLGVEHIYCAKNTTTSFWLVSPELNLMPQTGDKGIYLSFDAALTLGPTNTAVPTSTTGNRFLVAVSEDAGQTWTAANALVWGEDLASANYIYSSIPNGRGRAYHIDLRQYAGKVIRLALIEAASTTGSSAIHIANLELAEYEVPCFGSTNMSTNVRGGSVECTIVAEDSTSAWQYAIGAPGFTPSSAAAHNAGSKHFTINGLTMSSQYEIYIRSVCGASDTSSWGGPFPIATALGIRYEEPMAWTSSNIGTGWSRYSGTLTSPTETTYGWKGGAAGRGFASNHAYVNTYSTYCYLLTSPQIDLSSITSNTIQLGLDLALTGYNSYSAPSNPSNQTFSVVVSFDGGETWSSTPAAIWSEDQNADFVYSDIPASGTHYTVDMTQYAGEKINIGFYTTSVSGAGDNDLHLSNVSLDTISGSYCMPISRMSLMDSTFNSAKIAFRAPGINDALSIQYVCIPAGSLFKANLSQSTDTNVVEIFGLQPSMEYEVYARMMCQDSTWTSWGGPFTFHTVECSGVTGIKKLSASLHEVRLKLQTLNAGAATGFQTFIVEHDGVLDASQAVSTTSDTVNYLIEMEASAVYDVYARKICQPGDTSEWVGPYTFNAPYGIRYAESFNWESFSSEWTRYSGSLSSLSASNSGWNVGQKGYVFDDNHLYANAYSTNKYLAVSPEIDLTNIDFGKTITLSIDLALTAWSGASAGNNPAPSNYANQSFSVLVSTDGTWNTRRGYTWAEQGGNYLYSAIPADGENFQLDLSEYAGQAIRIGLYTYAENGGDNYIRVANLVLDTVVASSADCPGIQDLTVDGETLTTAVLHVTFKDPKTAPVAYFEVSADENFNNLIAMDTIRKATSYTIQGLAPSTVYYVRARQVCSNTEESAWSRRVAFSTGLGLRYAEDFNDANTFKSWLLSNQSAADVFGGQALTSASSSIWSRNTSNSSVFSDAHLQVNVWSNDCYRWAVSPAIDLTPNVGQSLLFAFDVALESYYGGSPSSAPDDKFMVIVSEDAGRTWSRQNATVWASGTNAHDYEWDDLAANNSNPKYHHYMLDFSRYAGKNVKIAFYAESTVSNGDNNLFVDNIDFNHVMSRTFNDTICEFTDYNEHGYHYAADQLQLGANNYRFISSTFDTITYLNIYVRPMPTTTYQATVCEGELFNQYGFNIVARQSGEIVRTVENPYGCDSIYSLQLTVNPKQYVIVEDTLCAGSSITLGGVTYYNNTVARDTLSSLVTGCDSIVTYYLTFTSTANLRSEIAAVVCEGQSYVDNLFDVNTQGVYTEKTVSTHGCDSTVTLHLYVGDAEGYAYDTVKVEDLPYMFGKRQLISAEPEQVDYSFSDLTTDPNCQVTLKVHVIKETSLSNVSTLNLSVAPNPAAIGEPIAILSDIQSSLSYRLTIYDALGRLVYESTDRSNIIPGMPASGFYTVRIALDDTDLQTKLLVK